MCSAITTSAQFLIHEHSFLLEVELSKTLEDILLSKEKAFECQYCKHDNYMYFQFI